MFETCGQGDAVPDLRHDSTEAVRDRVLALFLDREARRDDLAAEGPPVVERAQAQLREILAAVTGVPQEVEPRSV